MTTLKYTCFFNGKMSYTGVYQKLNAHFRSQKTQHLLESKLCQKSVLGGWNRLRGIDCSYFNQQ